MAIISGGRINIWNAVKKQFETVHPETEVARITDFADGIVQKLALTSAMTAVTALQKDSWFGKLLKMALTASGVKYNIAQNGYICFGEFFGGLIIQWGHQSYTSTNITFPITMTTVFNLWRNPLRFSNENVKRMDLTVKSQTASGFIAENDSSNNNDSTLNHLWISLGA